jgi:hypothetical protein
VLAAVIEGTTDDVFVKDVDGRFIAVKRVPRRRSAARGRS